MKPGPANGLGMLITELHQGATHSHACFMEAAPVQAGQSVISGATFKKSPCQLANEQGPLNLKGPMQMQGLSGD